VDIALKKIEANIKKPLAAPEIGKKPERVHRIRLSNYQVIGVIISVLALLIFATSRWGQHAPFFVEDVRWKPLQRFCRVTFTAKNPRNQSINAQALVIFFTSYESYETGEVSSIKMPTGSVKVPLNLAGSETRIVTKDFEYSKTTSGCREIVVEALGVTNGK
jgi:hypothetical protein